MPSLNTARACCSALVHNNKLYVAGGVSEGDVYTGSVERWDFLTGNWEQVQQLKHARANAVLIEYEGKMLGKEVIDISKNKT